MYRTVAVLIFLFTYTQAQDVNCDFTQNVKQGKTYYIYSPNYPNNYKAGVQCRWIAICPSGYNCKVDCNVDIPQSTSCSMDRLLISKTGDPLLASADYYCGRGTVTAVSTGRNISLGLISSRNSPGGKFKCVLTAQKSSSCTCGYSSRNRIVGGEETKPNEFPMMAGIVYVSEVTIKCGAVIISKNYVLTAAHCVSGKALTELAVVVGEHDVSTGNDTQATQAFRVASYLVHPKYTLTNYKNDIAIVRVDGVIKYSEYVGPVCLPFRFANWDFTGASVILLAYSGCIVKNAKVVWNNIVTEAKDFAYTIGFHIRLNSVSLYKGWGTTLPGGPTSKVLRKVDVNVISQSTCRASVPSVTPQQICTFGRGKDACQYDSGGPVLYPDPVTGSLFHAGIISYGRFCASNSPGVNTRVTSYLTWIEQNAPDDYCRK